MDRNTTSYSYAADGRKLRATYKTFPGQHAIDDNSSERNDSGLVRPGNGRIFVPSTFVETKTVDYVGNLIYEDNVIKKILIDGGYITFNEGNAPEYHFYIKDHLGNNRVVVYTSGEVEQVNHYYPYGGLMAESTNWNTQWYKYNGKARANESRESMYALLCRVQPRLDTVKELDRMHGLDWYDYGARWQDAAIGGRWHAMDPLCEKYYNVSPYVYCLNNPIKYIDQDGREVKQPKGGENFKLVGILSMIGGSLMMAGATTYSVVTEGSGIVVGGGQLFTAGYATFKAGVATYSTGIAIDAYESISRPNPVNIKDSKQESHSNNKAQSHGSKKRTGDKHAKQYTHGGTKNKPNFTPNQNKRKNADKHRNKGKVVD